VTRVALVTGAAGFIGRRLSERLVEDGWRVRGVDDERSGDWTLLSQPVERVDASLERLSRAQLRDLCEGVDTAFHLAAEKYNSPRATPETVIDVNVVATERLFAALGDAGVRHVVFTSSLYAYGGTGPHVMAEADVPRPATVYGLSKVAGEHLLRVAERDRGVSWTVARLFFIYGPRQYANGGYKSVIASNFERIGRDEPPKIFGDGEQALDYVYVDDCVDALVAMADPAHRGRVYNVATGRGVTINALTRAMLRAAGTSVEPTYEPPDWTQGTRRVGAPELAARELGWTASTTIDDGLARVWAWMNERSNT
jgi:nucleoside-diphosphate-sugar epimerase